MISISLRTCGERNVNLGPTRLLRLILYRKENTFNLRNRNFNNLSYKYLYSSGQLDICNPV